MQCNWTTSSHSPALDMTLPRHCSLQRPGFQCFMSLLFSLCFLVPIMLSATYYVQNCAGIFIGKAALEALSVR